MSRTAIEYKNEEKQINEIINKYEKELGLEENDKIPSFKFEPDKLSEKQKKRQIDMHFLKVFQKLEELKKSKEQDKKLNEKKNEEVKEKNEEVREKNEEENEKKTIQTEIEKKINFNKNAIFSLVIVNLFIFILLYKKFKT
jgi:hypothetical protein